MVQLRLFLFSSLITTSTLWGAGMNPDAYAQNRTPQFGWAAEALADIALHGDERVLDLGSADGQVTTYIADLVPDGLVVGLDLSTAMIDFASTQWLENPRPHLLFVQGNAADLPFNQQFDLITAFCTLNWIPDQKGTLAAIERSLIPGGRLLFVGPGKYDQNLSPHAEALVQEPQWRDHFPNFSPKRFYFTADEYIGMLQTAGLKPIEAKARFTETHFPSYPDFVAWLDPLVSFADHLSPTERDQFVHELAEHMLSTRPPSADGQITLHDMMIQILATKSPRG